MPRFIPRRLAAATAAAAALLGATLVVAPAAHAAPAVIGVTITATSAAEVGDTVTVTIAASNVEDLYAYDLALGYDAELLAFDEGSATFPSGGFGDATADADRGLAFLTHTRLGTSPGLVGAQPLVAFTFTALAAGDAVIELVSADLVGAARDTASLDVTAIDPATTVITAVVVQPSTTPSPSTSTPAAVPADASSGPLATTGVDAAPWLVVGVVALAAVALGVVLLLRRRAVTR
ncbi:cohesin domain-containing protein [Microbacterium sp. SORGH_AS_0862]|uniref:cohesin domain-containing protein n=1 Tax=Microbacterium sp. SORGH_AS_0862 TaxID=3041789 RepID=UPI00278D6163|nr:cohesin domain-containing protein [Microbacterium sp. SORGH_AS_0862]MDQ1205915.1 hypothetical protein [Microbacterium sp. SORGH_AS_0862]